MPAAAHAHGQAHRHACTRASLPCLCPTQVPRAPAAAEAPPAAPAAAEAPPVAPAAAEAPGAAEEAPAAETTSVAARPLPSFSTGFSFHKRPTKGPRSVIYVVSLLAAGRSELLSAERFEDTLRQNLASLMTVYGETDNVALLVCDLGSKNGGELLSRVVANHKDALDSGRLKWYAAATAMRVHDLARGRNCDLGYAWSKLESNLV